VSATSGGEFLSSSPPALGRPALDETNGQVDAAIARIDEEAAAGRGPFRDFTALLNTILGIANLAATSILAGTRTDMSRFASDGHLVSWAVLSPGQNESAGKRKSSRLRKGAPWLKTLLLHGQARPEESDLCGGRLDAYRNLPHAEGRRRTQRSWGQPFRSPASRNQSKSPSCSTCQAWLPRRTSTARIGSVMVSGNGCPDCSGHPAALRLG